MPADSNIAEIAEEHAQLEQNIANYDHAPAELRETKDLLLSIEGDLKIREARMEELIKKRKAEHKDLDKLQRSSTKRLLVRMKHGGKEGLERKLEKEEREYIEAAQDEHNENLAISELKAAAENARLRKEDLESQVLIRQEFLQRLNELYQSAFEGPSPDFPEEDAAEEELQQADLHFDNVQARLSHEKNVFGILDQAASCANQAQSSLQSANLTATYDAWQIQGGIWARMAETDDLIRAQTLAAQAHRLLDRARGWQPLVKSLEPGQIVKPDFVHSVFDNMYTDLMFQQKIQKSMDSMRKYQEGIFEECTASKGRIKSLEREANDAREFLKSRRRQLVAIRREILTRIREDGGLRVFTRPDGDASAVPQLPAYAIHPQEGSKVLARGEGIISLPVPAYEQDQSSRSISRADTSPSFPVSGMHSDVVEFTHLGEPSTSQTGNGPPTDAHGPVPAGLPRSLGVSSQSDLPKEPVFPGVGVPYSSETEARSVLSGSAQAPHDAPMQPARNDGGRNDTRRPQFASNNPYNSVLDPSE